MKRILMTLLILAAAAQIAAAKDYDYRPREGWPYLLEEFTAGSVRTGGGTVIQEGFYNICVVDGSLHYISEGTILKADMLQVQMVMIGEELFVNRMSWLYQVVHEEEGGLLLKKVSVDMDELGKSDIGYGISSATASTNKLTALGMIGQGTVNMDLTTAISQAKSGPQLPLLEQYYFLTGFRQTEATKSDFMKIPGLDKDGAKAFLKGNKIKWSRTEDLVKVLKYLTDNNIQ